MGCVNGVVINAFMIVLAGALSVAASIHADEEAAVAYPDEYRSWFHVKSAFVNAMYPDFEHAGGFRHIYANPQAVAGYREGIFPDGSIIVVDWLEEKVENGVFIESARRSVDVMMKDRARFAATGGWGFERFMRGSRSERSRSSAARRCFECHAGPGTRDMVFSRLRE